jgi:hypothetical protein
MLAVRPRAYGTHEPLFTVELGWREPDSQCL